MLRQHALFTVVNILTGSDAHKDAVAASNLPTLLLHHMRTGASAEVRGRAAAAAAAAAPKMCNNV